MPEKESLASVSAALVKLVSVLYLGRSAPSCSKSLTLFTIQRSHSQCIPFDAFDEISAQANDSYTLPSFCMFKTYMALSFIWLYVAISCVSYIFHLLDSSLFTLNYWGLITVVKATFLMADGNLFSDLVDPDCLDFGTGWNKGNQCLVPS